MLETHSNVTPIVK